jgi:uncharacterized protein (TIGR03083 family)
MAAESPWPVIHAERRALIADLRGLTAEPWQAPSLCGEWSIRQVLGHLTATARMTPGRFIGHFAAAGFQFNRMTAKDVQTETSASPDQQLAAFSALAGASTAPPGPVEAMLGEIIIHAEDIRRPLGIKHEYSPAAVVRVADFYKGSNLLIGAKRRIAGLTLSATDTDWSVGQGPQISGPVLSLVMLMTGRPATGDLTGPGLSKITAGGGR